MATRIAVVGAAGKMGPIVRAIAEGTGSKLTAAVEHAASPALGQDAGTLAGIAPAGVLVQAQLPDKNAADVWIDFSAPVATVANVRAAAAQGTRIVIGTTGLGADDKRVITQAAETTAVVFAPNMSVGVTVLLELVADAARALGPGYDIEIVEAHHRLKRDAPSGTALRLAEAAAEGSGRDLAKTAVYERHGDIGPRTAQEIGIQTIRGGDVIGDHTVFFLGLGERVEITHKAGSRDTFARGAVRAAEWLASRGPGLYDMRDVLGLR
jgi:4-hydroxy-tetrahydrodipicolinate reductase